MNSTTIDEIVNIQKKRTDRIIKIKNKHLCLVKEKIVNYANLGHKECLYVIPQFLIGYPPYDIIDICKYLNKALKKEGFIIHILTNECIYISWDINKLYK